MSILPNGAKKGCRDSYHAFLVENAVYDGPDEMPCIKSSDNLPERVISFTKALKSQDYNQWIHFYEHDCKIECIWNNPRKYLPIIKRFKGIISPDFSVYYDMPLAMQKWNIYRGRALSNWFGQNGVEVIPNLRWGDSRTYEITCCGIEKDKTIAVGTHGCIKSNSDKINFIDGLDYTIQKLTPKNIVVYGRIPEKLFCIARMYNTNIMQFESEFALAHKEVM